MAGNRLLHRMARKNPRAHAGEIATLWRDVFGKSAPPWVSSGPSPSDPPWRTSNPVFSGAETEASIRGFCSIFKLGRREPTQSSQGPAWPLDTHGHVFPGGRAQMNRCGEGEKERQREKDVFSGLGETKRFFKTTDQPPKLSRASDGSNDPSSCWTDRPRGSGRRGPF